MGEQKQYTVKMYDVANDREVEVVTTAGNTYQAYLKAEGAYKKENGLEWSATMYWLMVAPVFEEELDPTDFEATYDLHDNQLRVSVLGKAPKEHWMAFKDDLSMQWAPRQRLFKGAWSRSRVELLQHWALRWRSAPATMTPMHAPNALARMRRMPAGGLPRRTSVRMI